MSFQVLNSKGQPIVLNEMEVLRANYLATQIQNSLGYTVDTTTLTTIMKKVSEQKFFQVKPSDYLPINVGEGAWSAELLTYLSYSLGGNFSNGILNTGADGAKMAGGDIGLEAKSIKVFNWGVKIGWTIMELAQASKAGNWDLITMKESERKKNWDLGIQEVAFLGLNRAAGVASTACEGLINQSGLTPNTAVITKAIKSMTTTELTAFCAAVLAAYRAYCNYTAMPTHFVIPESDYLGLAAPASEDFPVKSKLQLLQEVFQTITQKPDFKILPLAYADQANSGLSVQRYSLYNYDETSLRMNVPVDYTNTMANSIDGFQFWNVGYGQFTGVKAYRPLEFLYFQY